MSHFARCDVYAALFALDVATALRQINRYAELWECRSWGSEGYGAAPRSKQYESIHGFSHGLFITINSMILYFKHIIHIDDFPLNGHPPSL